jgi:uncharacterized membrane protein YedE/YeeE
MSKKDFIAPGLNTDFEVQSLEADEMNQASQHAPWYFNIKYFAAGILFGILLIKSEVVSWFRIQEMFRFQSFHMYGVIGTAVTTGMISVWLIKKFKVKTIDGRLIRFYEKPFHKGNIYGGLIFGFGWALTGACPGPLFALIGSGAVVVTVALLSAIAGTWVYGSFQHRLPH